MCFSSKQPDALCPQNVARPPSPSVLETTASKIPPLVDENSPTIASSLALSEESVHIHKGEVAFVAPNGSLTAAKAEISEKEDGEALKAALAVSPNSPKPSSSLTDATQYHSTEEPVDTSGQTDQNTPQNVIDFTSTTPFPNEPQWSVGVRMRLFNFIKANPDKAVQTFDDLGISAPSETKVKNPTLAMFNRDKETKVYHCYICTYSNARGDRAVHHWNEHVGHLPHKCHGVCGAASCDAQFYSKEALKAHSYRRNVPNETCKDCNTIFEGRNFPKHPPVCPKRKRAVDNVDHDPRALKRPKRDSTAQDGDAGGVGGVVV